MRTHLLLLADSRLPAGGHAHSGGLEPASAHGLVADVADLADFLRGRLATTGLVSAALAAAACFHVKRTEDLEQRRGWERLQWEADARTPSPAQRAASVAQGRSLLRAVRTAWPDPVFAAMPVAPYHPIVLGAATAVTGGTPHDAAAIAAYGAVTGPASAAVRLLGLDPLAVQRVLAVLADDVDAVAAEAARVADEVKNDWAALPAVSAPVLDLLAEHHLRADLRLFES